MSVTSAVAVSGGFPELLAVSGSWKSLKSFLVIPEFESQADSLWIGFPASLAGKDHPLLSVEFSQLQCIESF